MKRNTNFKPTKKTNAIFTSALVGAFSVASAQISFAETVEYTTGSGKTVAGVVVPESECKDGGGTTYTSEGIKVYRDANGDIKNCGAFTLEERAEMRANDDDDNRAPALEEPEEPTFTPVPEEPAPVEPEEPTFTPVPEEPVEPEEPTFTPVPEEPVEPEEPTFTPVPEEPVEPEEPTGPGGTV